MIDNEKIKGIIGHFREMGENVRVRDIAYTLLAEMFADTKTVYQCLFGGETDGYDEYSSDPMRDTLRDYLVEDGCIRSVSADAGEGGIRSRGCGTLCERQSKLRPVGRQRNQRRRPLRSAQPLRRHLHGRSDAADKVI